MPKISVVIPTYNSIHYLAAAIDSVLSQSYKDFELLVVDDGSTDDTEGLLRGYGNHLRSFRQPNSGVAARNHGIRESQGHYVAFLDADDVWHRNKLEQQLIELDGHQHAYRACFSAFTITNSELTPLSSHRSPTAAADLDHLLSWGNVVGTPSTVLAERSLLVSLGGFDPQLSICADWDMWVRVASRSEFLYIDQPLVSYRQHDSNMSRSIPLLENDSVRVLEKGFAMPGLSRSTLERRPQAFARNYMALAGSYFRAHRYRDFLRCGTRAITLDFHQFGYLLAYPVRWVRRHCNRKAS